MPRLDGIDVDEPGEHFGDFLGERAGERRGRRCPGLPSRQQQHGHAAPHRDLQAAAGVGGEFHRRHHEAVRLADERSFAPLPLAAGNQVQHLQRGRDVLGLHPAGPHVLGGARDRGVTGVEIHLEGIGYIARDHGALEKMNMLQHIDDAPDVVQVLDCGFAIHPVRIHDVDRRARSAEVGALAGGLQIETRILRVQHEVARRLGERVFDEGARKQQSALSACLAAGPGHDLETGFRRVGQSHLGEQAQRCGVNLLDIVRAQRLVAAAAHARPHRPQVVRQGRRALGAPGVPPGRAPCNSRAFRHFRFSGAVPGSFSRSTAREAA